MKYANFTKMSGAFNDFIVIDDRAEKIKDKRKTAIRLCDRKGSIGGDGVLYLVKSKQSDFKMRIFNPDGSEAEMCGNGIRCIAKFAADKKIARKSMTIETLAGEITADVKGSVVKARMIEPKDLKLNFAVPVNGSSEKLSFINTGVPHAIRLSGNVDNIDVENVGRAIRTHRHFAPRGTNVNFVSVTGRPNQIRVRTYERGVEGETLACGTGSTAAALVTAALKGFTSPVKVLTQGGETLKIHFKKNGDAFTGVYLEGPVITHFEGRVEL